MTTLMITLDEREAEAIRQQAQRAGKTVEAWVAEAALQRAGSGDSRHWVDQFLEIADRSGGDSRGETWTRKDLYRQ